MTKHCSTIVPPTNFPSEFSENGKRHNISLKESSAEDSQISSNDETSLNNNIPRLRPNSLTHSQVRRNLQC